MPDLDHLLGSQLKVRLLRVLVPLRAPVSARQAARLAKVSTKGAQVLDELAEIGIVDKREGTAQHFFQFQPEHYLAEPLKALFTAEESKLREISTRLRSAVGRSDQIVFGAIFGSSARGDAGAGSDLDVLLVIRDRESRTDEADRLLEIAPELARRYGARVSPLVIDVDEWRERLASADSLITAIAREAIPFMGNLPLADGG